MKSGRSPAGRLRNFGAMSSTKLAKTYNAVRRENNDPEAIKAIEAVLYGHFGSPPKNQFAHIKMPTAVANRFSVYEDRTYCGDKTGDVIMSKKEIQSAVLCPECEEIRKLVAKDLENWLMNVDPTGFDDDQK